MKKVYGAFVIGLVSCFALMLSFQAVASCEVIELSQEQVLSGYQEISKIEAGAHSFTTRCNRNQVIDDLKTEACDLGADAIVIVKEKKPGAFRSCFTIEAIAYSIVGEALRPGIDTDDLLKAAKAGDTEAQFLLGKDLFESATDQHGTADAYAWLNVAASQNHADAVRLRDEMEQLLSWSELAVAQNRAYEIWLEYYDVFGHVMDTGE